MATGTVITDAGFLAVYREDEDDNGDGRIDRRSDQDVRLPRLVAGGHVDCDGLEAEEHATKPPARYTEASLVRRLEELGVGRPSTYASIIGTIQDRGYVWKRGTALVPSFTAFAVVGLLEDHFANLVDYGFTASMEDDLDDIASGTEEQIPWLERFYFGEHKRGTAQPGRAPGHSLAVDGTHGLKEAVSLHLDEIDAREVNSISLATDAQGREIVVRVGRYGPYLQRGEDRAAVPGDLAPDELTLERAAEMLEHPSSDRSLGTDPASGKTVLVREGRFGPYVQLGEAAVAADKPRTASLLKTMSVSDITLEQALQILQLPRTVGVDPETGEEIVAANGRFGPFMKRGSETRSLETEAQLFTMTIEEALSVFAAPKQRRYGTSAAPLRELGVDPESGSAIVLRSGRFGPYVTDGTTNASLRRGDDPDELTLERAVELIADRRAAGPSKRTTARKAVGAKKAGARKATGTAKKAGVRKTAGARKAAGTVKKAGARKAAVTKKAAPVKKAGARTAPGAAIRTAATAHRRRLVKRSPLPRLRDTSAAGLGQPGSRAARAWARTGPYNDPRRFIGGKEASCRRTRHVRPCLLRGRQRGCGAQPDRPRRRRARLRPGVACPRLRDRTCVRLSRQPGGHSGRADLRTCPVERGGRLLGRAVHWRHCRWRPVEADDFELRQGCRPDGSTGH